MQNTPLKANANNSSHIRLFLENNAYLVNCHIYNPEILGKVLSNNNNFYGDILVTDTLQNNTYDYIITVSGNLTNNGIIKSQVPNSYSLTLNVNGDVNNNAFILDRVNLKTNGDLTNNGVLDNFHTEMNGTNDQYIHLQNGNYISGQMQFVSDINTSPYQWYWNEWAIENPPYPDPAIFSGETTNTLTFLNDVNQNRLGTYYCNTGGGNSRNIIVDEITAPTTIELTAIIEGPFNESNMNTTLNSLTLLPLDQPYSIAPWNYEGVESVTSIPNANVVDWILVQMYDAPSASLISAGNMIFESAAFLLDDGSVVDLDGNSDLSFELSIVNSLFVKLSHRNHIPIISATGLTKIGNAYTYDFTTSISKAYQFNQKNIDGKAVMIGGDANADAMVDLSDISIWKEDAGTNGYKAGDINMDGEVDNPDKNDVIIENFEIEGPASYNILRGGPAGAYPEAIPVQISGANGANPYTSNLNQWTGSWQAPQAIYDQGAYVNDPDNWSDLGTGSGSTWYNGTPGSSYGILVVDLLQLRSIYNISVFQMFSDGKTTHVAFAGHAETGSAAPDASDTGWVEFLPKSAIGEGVNGNPITIPTKFSVSTSTRFVKIMVWNDGSLGSSGYIELKGVKMY
jgi:hypothetical protein